ncbi:hypothetical protein KR026_005597, partial [Drosophila bipectinata]
MARCWILACTCFLGILINCHAGKLFQESRIINGSIAKANESRHLVSIRLRKHDNNFGSGHICGGALISVYKVLTAAHCLYNNQKKRYRQPSEFVVVMGTLNRFERQNGTIVAQVSSMAYMSTFSPDTMRDDVGILFLSSRVLQAQFATPIQLTREVTPPGRVCQIAGWGRTEQSSLSNILLTVNVTTIRYHTCRTIYKSGLLPGMMCAGLLQGGTDSCQGDSGGPLVHDGRVVGVVSWGYGCAEPGLPGVYVDIQYYRQWIEERSGTNSNKITSDIIIVTLYWNWI